MRKEEGCGRGEVWIGGGVEGGEEGKGGRKEEVGGRRRWEEGKGGRKEEVGGRRSGRKEEWKGRVDEIEGCKEEDG